MTEADRRVSVRLHPPDRLRVGTPFLRRFHRRGTSIFKTRHDGQNLNRARVQLKLTESIERREKQIRKILEQC